jgi:hypothetical protein
MSHVVRPSRSTRARQPLPTTRVPAAEHLTCLRAQDHATNRKDDARYAAPITESAHSLPLHLERQTGFTRQSVFRDATRNNKGDRFSLAQARRAVLDHQHGQRASSRAASRSPPSTTNGTARMTRPSSRLTAHKKATTHRARPRVTTSRALPRHATSANKPTTGEHRLQRRANTNNSYHSAFHNTAVHQTTGRTPNDVSTSRHPACAVNTDRS